MKGHVAVGVRAILFIAVAGCGARPTENLEVRTSAVTGGQLETGYPAVGCVSTPGTCTGTLIAPNLVLSAKHCGAKTKFFLGPDCDAPTDSRDIDYSIPFHPSEDPVVWTNPDLYPNDLVVYHLSSPIYDVRPLQLNPDGYPANGTNCVAVGYGDDGMGSGMRNKRSATVTVTWSGDLTYVYDGLGYTLMESAIEIAQGPGGSSPPPGLPQSGDSGGPLLCNGSGVIKGVYAGDLYYPWFVNKYYTALDTGHENFSSAWVTSVASNYVNEPMISATRQGDRFDLFIRGTDGALWTKTWDGANWLPSQWGWNWIGGFITGTPEAVSWGPNRIDVFMRGGDSNPQTNYFSSMSLWHAYWSGGGWSWQHIDDQGLASHPVAVSWGVNRLDVFALLSNGHIEHYFSNDGTSWFIEPVPTNGGPATFLPEMKAFSTSSGSLDLYAVGIDSKLYHTHYNSSGFSGWTNLGGPFRGTPAVTSWGGGRQDIFMTGTDANIRQKTRIGGVFSPSDEGWWSLGGPIDGTPAAASMQYNWLTLVSNAPSTDDAFKLASKGWFNGSQWDPSNTTWFSFTGSIANGAPTLLGDNEGPVTGVRFFAMDGGYHPGLNVRTPSSNWGGFGSLGGTGSW
jgi:Trypsin